MADIVATMQRSLDTLGDLPDFRGGPEKLEAYRRRLQDHVEGALSEALQSRRSERVRELWELMTTIKRVNAAETLYVNVRGAPLIQIWTSLERIEQQEQRTTSSDIPINPIQKVDKFMDQLLVDIDSEARWCEAVLEGHVSLLLKLVQSVFSRVGRGIQGAVERGVEGSDGVMIAMALQKSAARFAGKLFGETLADCKECDELAGFAGQFAEPFLSVMDRYGELEVHYLAAQVQPWIPNSTLIDEDMDNVHQSLKSEAEHVFIILDGARDRCISFTKCIGAGVVYGAVDEVLASFLSAVSTVVSSVFNKYNQYLGRNQEKQEGTQGPTDELDELGSGDQSALPPSDVTEDLTGVLQLLLFNEWLSGRLSLLEGQLRNLIPKLKNLLEEHTSQSTPEQPNNTVDPRKLINSNKEFDFVSYVLHSRQEALSALKDLVRVGTEARFMALSASYTGVRALGSQIDDLVYDLLIYPVGVNIKGMAALALWRQEEQDNAFQLPSFSGYPTQNAINVGEYLMMLPQQLECLLPVGGATSEDGLASKWLDKIASGAAQLYVTEILKIPTTTLPGWQQLGADVDYVVNVVTALGVPLSGALSTLSVLVKTSSEEEFKGRSESGLEDGSMESNVVKLLAQMRSYQQ
eukprot:TRINITY_DN2312_c0_g2_i1.p1 TRINITY_DN2312_c0_g2~~TRINITY_DN2312_c0_g2_i1.p1  ORF type:complete len:732 (+),score=140.61 TRINITY_DN2312_c0_g2_i1:291-2198(+)